MKYIDTIFRVFFFINVIFLISCVTDKQSTVIVNVYNSTKKPIQLFFFNLYEEKDSIAFISSGELFCVNKGTLGRAIFDNNFAFIPAAFDSLNVIYDSKNSIKDFTNEIEWTLLFEGDRLAEWRLIIDESDF